MASAQHAKPKEEEIIRFAAQTVVVPDFSAQGYVLDIGGGGEGIIGLVKPRQVVAIDLIKRELEEAPPGPLKIVMDARELKFLDRSFETVTAFYSLMYMSEADQVKALAETFRVLAPGGRFLIWEGAVPARTGEKKWAMFRLEIKLPDREIKTGYGVPLGEKLHDAAYFTQLAEAAGFKPSKRTESGTAYFLEFMKPPAT